MQAERERADRARADRARSRGARGRRRWIDYLLLAVVALLVLFPLYAALVVAIQPIGELTDMGMLVPTNVSLSAFPDAFRDAEFLTEAIADGLSGRATMANALAGYERRRNEAARPGFEEAIHWAMFRPFPAEFLEQRAALRATAAA